MFSKDFLFHVVMMDKIFHAVLYYNMQHIHLWQLKIRNNIKKNTFLFRNSFFFFHFGSPMANRLGNENCRETVNIYQIKCNLPLESMHHTQNSKLKICQLVFVSLLDRHHSIIYKSYHSSKLYNSCIFNDTCSIQYSLQ